MSYTVDPSNPASPLDTDDASQMAAELRAIKSKLQTLYPGTIVTFSGTGDVMIATGVPTLVDGLRITGTVTSANATTTPTLNGVAVRKYATDGTTLINLVAADISATLAQTFLYRPTALAGNPVWVWLSSAVLPAPGTAGNLLTSTGTAWASQAPATLTGGYNVQTFNASGTWTKPTGAPTTARVFVEVISGGGSGAASSQSTVGGGGGGGGCYQSKQFQASDLTATVAVTIGAGGSGVSPGSPGNKGGTSSFGAYLSVEGGGAGGHPDQSGTDLSGGTGGGAAFGSIVGGVGRVGGGGGGCCDNTSAATGISQGFPPAGVVSVGASGAVSVKVGIGGSGVFGGGGGGGGLQAATWGNQGGSSVFGGGGGSGGRNQVGVTSGGSSLNAGAGGSGGGNSSYPPTAGTAPGGGGGGCINAHTSGAGAAGRVIITTSW